MTDTKAGTVLEKARLHFEKGEFARAHALLDPLDTRAGIPVRQLHAASLYLKGDVEESLPLLMACLSESPSACSEQAWKLAITGLMAKGDYRTATELFDQALTAGKVTVSLCTTMLDELCESSHTDRFSLAGRVYPNWERLSGGTRVVRRYESLYATQINNGLRKANSKLVVLSDAVLDQVEILIPTFNRRDTILATLDEMFKANPDLAVLVSDNASDDGTYDAIEDRFGHHPNLRVIRNQTNLGYSGNIERLIHESARPYGIVTSDEDPVVVAEIPRAIRAMQEAAAQMMSPLVTKGKRIFRGRTNQGKIRPQDFQQASFFTSGIVLEMQLLRDNIKTLRVALNKPQQIYPQQILTCFLLMHGTGIWYPRPLAYIRHNLKSSIHDEVDEGRYNGVLGRWQQFRLNVEMARYLSAPENGGNTEISITCDAIVEELARGIMVVLRNGAKREYPEFSDLF